MILYDTTIADMREDATARPIHRLFGSGAGQHAGLWRTSGADCVAHHLPDSEPGVQFAVQGRSLWSRAGATSRRGRQR
jgi:hypothetical protein